MSPMRCSSPSRTIAWVPGRSRAYPPHLIHSTAHPEAARVIRVTGTDLDRIARYGFDPAHDKIVTSASVVMFT